MEYLWYFLGAMLCMTFVSIVFSILVEKEKMRGFIGSNGNNFYVFGLLIPVLLYIILSSATIIVTVMQREGIWLFVAKILRIEDGLTKVINDSGFAFAILIIVISLILPRLLWLYNLVFKNTQYTLNLKAIDATTVLVITCVISSIVCLGIGDKENFFVFFALIVGKFFWLDNFLGEKEKKEKTSLSAPIIIEGIAVSILFLMISSKMEKQMYATLAGFIIGFVIWIIWFLRRNKNTSLSIN